MCVSIRVGGLRLEYFPHSLWHNLFEHFNFIKKPVGSSSKLLNIWKFSPLCSEKWSKAHTNKGIKMHHTIVIPLVIQRCRLSLWQSAQCFWWRNSGQPIRWTEMGIRWAAFFNAQRSHKPFSHTCSALLCVCVCVCLLVPFYVCDFKCDKRLEFKTLAQFKNQWSCIYLHVYFLHWQHISKALHLQQLSCNTLTVLESWLVINSNRIRQACWHCTDWNTHKKQHTQIMDITVYYF